ncbi:MULTISPECIES: DsbA family protein [unclassified Luteococcus]|uniref:DsbA family protein n=1 Tax=unclassified Luteococcus TaxID=2639923 RepID=UPI00313EF430
MSQEPAQHQPPHTPGQGWQHGASAAPSPSKPNRLPWVLVAMLTALSVVLASMLAMQSSELKRLRAGEGTPQTAASGSAQPAATGAQPSQNPEAIAAMKKLPRRNPEDPTAKGKVDAPVVMIEWSDFRCPFCSVWARETAPQLKPYIDSGSLRIEHRDLVLFGDQSMNTAMAARAAGNQDKFWEFYDAVHAKAPTSGHPTIKQADLLAFAKAAGVPDLARFTKDSTSAQTRAAVEKDVNEARSLGLSGTPFFVVNTTPLSGAQPLEVFTQAIEQSGGKK